MSLGGTDNSDGTDATARRVNAGAQGRHRGVRRHRATTATRATSPSPSAADLALSVGAFTDNNTLSRADDIVADYSNEGPRAVRRRRGPPRRDEAAACSGAAPASCRRSATRPRTAASTTTSTAPAWPRRRSRAVRAHPPGEPDAVARLRCSTILQNTADHRTDRRQAAAVGGRPVRRRPQLPPVVGLGRARRLRRARSRRMNDATDAGGADRGHAAARSRRRARRLGEPARGRPGALRRAARARCARRARRVDGRSHQIPVTRAAPGDPAAAEPPRRTAGLDSDPGLDRQRHVLVPRALARLPRPHALRAADRARGSSDSPVVARVRFSWTHNYSDGDLVVRFGTGTNTASPVWQRYAPGAPAADSMVTEPGGLYTGTKHYFFHADLTGAGPGAGLPAAVELRTRGSCR